MVKFNEGFELQCIRVMITSLARTMGRTNVADDKMMDISICDMGKADKSGIP